MLDFNNRSHIAFIFAIFSLIILLALAFSGFSLESLGDHYREEPSIYLSVLIVVTAVALLTILGFLAISFAALNLSDKRFALSLPEGSVRALIALLLITLFAVMGIYFYTELRNPVIENISRIECVNSNFLSEFPKKEIFKLEINSEDNCTKSAVEDEILYNIEKRVTDITTEDSRDFALQILTTISTLVVAVSGFYFGSRATSRQPTSRLPSGPIVRNIDKNRGKRDNKQIEYIISGRNLLTTKFAKLIKGKIEILFTDITSTEVEIKCKLKLGEEHQVGKYDLIVQNQDGTEDRLNEAFEIIDNEDLDHTV